MGIDKRGIERDKDITGGVEINMYYFAYGSNMNHQQMKNRCPNSRFTKRAILERHKFVYDGYARTRNGAVANVIGTGRKDDIVWGGLFKINEDNRSALDCYEGYPIAYDRKEVRVKDDEGNCYTAIVYFRAGRPKSKPSEDYRNIVIQGAKDCNLPEEYIRNNL